MDHDGMTRDERALTDHVAEAAWNAVFHLLDGEPGVGGPVTDYVAGEVLRAARTAMVTMFGRPMATCHLCGSRYPEAPNSAAATCEACLRDCDTASMGAGKDTLHDRGY